MINKSFIFFRDYLPGVLGKKFINLSKKYKQSLGQEIIGSISILDINYYVSESLSISESTLNLKNGRGFYLEDQSFIYLEYADAILQPEITQSDFAYNISNLNINYYISESIATGSTVAYQNYNYVYLQDNSYLLLD
jgi:hypothetical protein